MIVLFNSKKECYGCTSCYASCPNKAIEMRIDEEGFEYPYINSEKCIECGKCLQNCPYRNYVKEM